MNNVADGYACYFVSTYYYNTSFFHMKNFTFLSIIYSKFNPNDITLFILYNTSLFNQFEGLTGGESENIKKKV